MIFSELYSAYYHTVAAILTRAAAGEVTDRELGRLVTDMAFSESAMTILSSLKSGKWQLLRQNNTPVLRHSPTMPLTVLEKRWLKSVSEDPRVKLFDVQMPDLDGVEPLFTRDDYKIFDQYADGDPFEDEGYIARFRLLREAIRTGSPVKVTVQSRRSGSVRVRFFPGGFEYSPKDDKIRVLASGCRFRRFNLARITSCCYYHGEGAWTQEPRAEQTRELTLEISDERNAPERVMLHFAHFEKKAERVDDSHYRLRVRYCESDEAEMVIRVLSFGPYVKVIAPDEFAAQIRARLASQRKLL